MPRKYLSCSKHIPYHVTIRTIDKEWFPLPLTKMWDLAQASLEEVAKLYPVEVISFVLMSNHYHMLLITPEGNMNTFISEFNKCLLLKVKKINPSIIHIFEDHYKWSLIHSQKHFINCYKYIYQNPVRAGVVLYCEDYPFSSLKALIENVKFGVTLHDRYGFKDEYGLRWLNQKVDHEAIVAFKKDFSRAIVERN